MYNITYKEKDLPYIFIQGHRHISRKFRDESFAENIFETAETGL